MDSRRTRYYVLYSNSGRGSFRHFAPIYRSRYSLPARAPATRLYIQIHIVYAVIFYRCFSRYFKLFVVGVRTCCKPAYLTDFVLDKYLIIVKRQYFRLLLLMLKCNLVNIPMYLSKVMITCVLY